MAASGTGIHAVSQVHDGTESGGTRKSWLITVEIGARMHDSEGLAIESCTSGSTIHRFRLNGGYSPSLRAEEFAEFGPKEFL